MTTYVIMKQVMTKELALVWKFTSIHLYVYIYIILVGKVDSHQNKMHSQTGHLYIFSLAFFAQSHYVGGDAKEKNILPSLTIKTPSSK